LDLLFQSRPALKRYSLAVLCVAAALGIRLALNPIVGAIAPLLIFTLAEVAAALLCGLGPGLVAIVLGTCSGYFFFLRPGGRLSGAPEAYYLLLNIAVSMALVWMADAMHRSRDEARRSARESENAHRRLADLLERIGDAFLSFDRDWKCLHANQRAAALAGKDAGELPGKTFAEILPGIFTGEYEAALERGLKENASVTLDGRAVPEGIWFELKAHPGTENVSVFIRDVTARKQAEIAIAQSEEYFRRIFDESPVGLMIVDMEGKYVRVNRAFCRMMEYTEAELTGKTTMETTPKEDQDTSGFLSKRQQFLIQGQIDHLQLEKRYVTKRGETLWTNLNASILDSGDGRRFFLGIVENVTDRRLVEEQLREAQKLESLGVLAGGIAHDFNNLLTGILGNASLGLDLAPLNSPVRPLLQRLVKASERAADLTRQLLAYAGKGRFVLTAIDLSRAVQDISSLIRASFPHHVRLELELSPTLPAVEADPAQIQQIIMNLLLNAAEAIPDDRQGVVAVRTKELYATEEDLRGMLSGMRASPGRFAVLEVEDNGLGMGPDTQSRIFEPFFTTKFTGRGLGLPAVLGIAGSYKGALSVRSEPGKGSRFRVLLPAQVPALDAPAETPEEELKGSGTILVVDDEPMVLTLARTVLERFGYNVLAATRGEEALNILRRAPEDISAVILDITMPGMDGEEAFRGLKSIRSDVPVILSSGHSESDAMGRFSGEGLAGYLQKPYTAAQLAEKLRSALPAKMTRPC
jgi:PAS domain S-box-containing protein